MGFCTLGGKRFSMEVKEAVILSKISEFKALNLELILESMREVSWERRVVVFKLASFVSLGLNPPSKTRGAPTPSRSERGSLDGLVSNVIILGSPDGKKPGFSGTSDVLVTSDVRKFGKEKKSSATLFTSPIHLAIGLLSEELPKDTA